MITIKAWTKWQTASISGVKRNRARRAKNGEGAPPADANYVMQSVSVSATLDGDFKRFAVAVGGRSAETYLLRCLQYVAIHGAMRGEIDLEPEEYGPHALTKRWDPVCSSCGIRVHAALLSSGLATDGRCKCADRDQCTCADRDPVTCADPGPCTCVAGGPIVTRTLPPSLPLSLFLRSRGLPCSCGGGRGREPSRRARGVSVSVSGWRLRLRLRRRSQAGGGLVLQAQTPGSRDGRAPPVVGRRR